ncbi:hypothetical protein PSUB009319_43870 [Ralstonia sp. SET104]|nr:hypothetical protein PSUB009319_43870 [Ralstonia sp. SET104]
MLPSEMKICERPRCLAAVDGVILAIGAALIVVANGVPAAATVFPAIAPAKKITLLDGIRRGD